jgi:PPOX class probable F420-dependent enzyme
MVVGADILWTTESGRTVNQEERRTFVRDHRTCIFGYARKADGPAMTVVYYVMDGDELLVSTMAERAKAKAVARDGRVSMCILDEKWPLSYLQVYGKGIVDYDPELAVDVLTRVVGLMAGEEVPASRRPQLEQMARDEQRVVIRVRPYATFETPPRHVHKMSDIDTLTHFTSKSLPW